ncbi:hypothetical protein BB561_006615 [Smittium simulii]|uniref:Zn(2)-C6 fungal-type domain-containing protein n=1 Tax=Smittium simulii TaxID=133385 RepID=A0A2T9Y2U1_9FUNG|nr:hypothetical protein BB561_006615 [Smittium simulii]
MPSLDNIKHELENENENEQIKKKSKKIINACTNCQNSHLSCDEKIPCSRCDKKNIAETCQYSTKKLAKYLLKDFESENLLSLVNNAYSDQDQFQNFILNPDYTGLFTYFSNPKHSQPPNAPFPLVNFAKEKSLNSIPELDFFKIFSHVCKNDVNTEISYKMRQFFNMSYQKSKTLNNPFDFAYSKYQMNSENSNNFDELLENFVSDSLTTSSSAINKPTEGYSHNDPFFYTVPKKEAKRIFSAIETCNSTIVAAKANYPISCIEFSNQIYRKNLLKIERFIKFTSTPTLVCKRSGLISLVGREFTILTGWTEAQMLSKNMYIYDIISAENTVEYCEKACFEITNHLDRGIVLHVDLIKNDNKTIRCSSRFIIKRDLLDIPSIIIGSFLPILT